MYLEEWKELWHFAFRTKSTLLPAAPEALTSWPLTVLNGFAPETPSVLLFLFLYCWHYDRCPPFPHLCLPPPSSLLPSPGLHHTIVCVHGLCSYVLWVISSPSFIHSPSPLGGLSVCPMYLCLWFYFVCQFILLIRFHIWVKSYASSLSLTSLFHLV